MLVMLYAIQKKLWLHQLSLKIYFWPFTFESFAVNCIIDHTMNIAQKNYNRSLHFQCIRASEIQYRSLTSTSLLFCGVGIVALQYVLLSAVQWSEWAVGIHISPPSGASLPPAHPADLGQRGALSWAPCATPHVPRAAYFTHGSAYCQPTLPIHASVPHFHTSILYVCISIPVLQIAPPIFACHTEWSKSEREKQISYINTYTRNQEAFFFFPF